MKIGIVFAGQGAQYEGMGKDLYDNYERARAVFDEAGDEVKNWCFTADKETLRKTHITQPTVYTVTMAAYEALLGELEKEGLLTGSPDDPIEIAGFAGFSLGEYAALTAAGCIDDLDKGLEIVETRGRLMEAAGLDENGENRGGMAAAFGPAEKVVEAVAAVADGRILEAVNFNNPKQTVVAGEFAALDDFLEHAKDYRLKCKRLSVGTAFHCAMMAPASDNLRPELEKVGFCAPHKKVYSNITAEDIMAGYEEGQDVNEYLADVMARQVKSPVIFVEVIRHMVRDGIEMFIEVGPGETLSGFVRKTEKEVKAHNVEDKESLELAVASLKEALAERAAQ